MPIVFSFKMMVPPLNLQHGLTDDLASRMSRDVVYAFLKKPKHFPSHLSAELHILIWVWALRSEKLDVAGCEIWSLAIDAFGAPDRQRCLAWDSPPKHVAHGLD